MIWKRTPASAADTTATKPASSPAASAAPPAAPVASPPLHKVEFGRSSAPPPAAPVEIASAAPESLDGQELREKAAAAKAISATFGEIVSLLMKSKDHRHWSLADVEQIVVPAIVAGQVSVATAQSKSSGLVTPAGFVLWARVSAAIDQRLSANPSDLNKLALQDWKSGEIIWIVLALGDRRVLDGQIQVLQKQWGDKPAKILVRNDGKLAVSTLSARAPAA